MKRILFAVLLCMGVVALAASSAFAHGGQFRGPGGAVPPGLREPSDPTPPPPPPPTGGPPVTTPPDPSGPPAPPPVTTPGTPPSVPPPQTGTQPDSPGGRKPGSIGYENWTFWWGNNNDDILHIKESIYAKHASPDTPLGELGGVRGQSTDAKRATAKQVKTVLMPALRWAMDPKNKLFNDTASAGYIALAKVTDDPTDIDLIASGIYKDGKPNTEADQIVRESAALALGLLRRTESERQFDAKELDKVRDLLFQIFDDEGLKEGRTRGFAMLALGLLGDQPTTRGPKPSTGAGGGLLYAPDPISTSLPTTERIFELLNRKYALADLPVCVMLALGMQKPDTIKPEMLDVLVNCGLKGKIGSEEASDDVAAHAALALGRVGTKDHIKAVVNMMKVPSTKPNVKRSAAIALGQLGRRVDGAERAAVATELVKAIEEAKDDSVKNFGLISLAYLIQADIKSKRTDVLNAKGKKPMDFLLKLTDDGRLNQRPFGALALGLIGREIGATPNVVEYGEIKLAAIDVLRNGLKDQKMDKRSRAAFAVALGILQDEGSKKNLVGIVSEKSEDKELRGYAAVALGMIGQPTKDATDAISAAMKERSSEELRQQTAIALGLLGVKSAVDLLLTELKEADSQNVQGQVVLALARIGDERTIEPLVGLLKDGDKPDATRALACAGLGLIGDLEDSPSLARISKDINYRAAPDTINEVLTIL